MVTPLPHGSASRESQVGRKPGPECLWSTIGRFWARFSISPELPEAIWCQSHIALRTEQRAMPEISLDRTGLS